MLVPCTVDGTDGAPDGVREGVLGPQAVVRSVHSTRALAKWMGLKYSPGPAHLAVGCISSEERAFYDLSTRTGTKTVYVQAWECPVAKEGKR